jgi:HAD superfamily hydrolase (TIGR01509 family)
MYKRNVCQCRVSFGCDISCYHHILAKKQCKTTKDEDFIVTHIHGVILDVDGTLVNSNDAHAHSWVQAMAENGHQVPFDKVRPLIGMGGDKVLPETIGVTKDSDEGKQISQRRKQIFRQQYLPTIKPFPGTRDLLTRMRDAGLTLVIATSAEPDELSKLLQAIGPDASDFFKQETSSKDAPRSKPDPDIMHAALQRLGYPASQAIMLGDTAYDIEAAAKANVPTIALRCGGWSDNDLQEALVIYNDPADLLAHFDSSPLTQDVASFK